MVAQNRVKRQIVRVDVLEFAAKLRVLDSGNPVLDKIVAEQQHQIPAAFVTSFRTRFRHPTLIAIAGPRVSQQQNANFVGLRLQVKRFVDLNLWRATRLTL